MINRKEGYLNVDNNELDDFMRSLFDMAKDSEELDFVHRQIEISADMIAEETLMKIESRAATREQ